MAILALGALGGAFVSANAEISRDGHLKYHYFCFIFEAILSVG